MLYEKIKNPKTGKNVDIYSKEGIRTITSYSMKGGGTLPTETSTVSGKPELLKKTLTSRSIAIDDVQSTAAMNVKASRWRDILLENEMVKKWDMLIGWFLNVCLQNDATLFDKLYTDDIPMISYNINNPSPKFYVRNKKMIIMNVLGGAAYRGITNFISCCNNDDSYRLHNYAPRSHDFDTSMVIKNWKYVKEIDHIITDYLILFSDLIFKEFEENCDNFFTKSHTDGVGYPIKFIPITNAHINKKEIPVWRHSSGMLGISALRSKNTYINIRLSMCMEYYNVKSKKTIQEYDHILELVVWNPSAPSALNKTHIRLMEPNTSNTFIYKERDMSPVNTNIIFTGGNEFVSFNSANMSNVNPTTWHALEKTNFNDWKFQENPQPLNGIHAQGTIQIRDKYVCINIHLIKLKNRSVITESDEIGDYLFKIGQEYVKNQNLNWTIQKPRAWSIVDEGFKSGPHITVNTSYLKNTKFMDYAETGKNIDFWMENIYHDEFYRTDNFKTAHSRKSNSISTRFVMTGINFYLKNDFQCEYACHISIGQQVVNNEYEARLSELKNSQKALLFNDTIDLTYCTTFKLESLSEAGFDGLINRSAGAVAAKCRQDYSRLYPVLLIVNAFPELSQTQGDIDSIIDKIHELTLPPAWIKPGYKKKKADIDLAQKTDFNNPVTMYIQCRTSDQHGSPERILADLKFAYMSKLSRDEIKARPNSDIDRSIIDANKLSGSANFPSEQADDVPYPSGDVDDFSFPSGTFPSGTDEETFYNPYSEKSKCLIYINSDNDGNYYFDVNDQINLSPLRDNLIEFISDYEDDDDYDDYGEEEEEEEEDEDDDDDDGEGEGEEEDEDDDDDDDGEDDDDDDDEEEDDDDDDDGEGDDSEVLAPVAAERIQGHLKWHELDEDQRWAAVLLGWNVESWDNNMSTDNEVKRWSYLSEEETLAASILGYNEQSWNVSVWGYEAPRDDVYIEDDESEDDDY